MKKSVTTFLKAKKEGKKLALLTAYDYSSAKLVDSCEIDGILVGDSLGMVCLGYKDTLPVTIEDMIYHTKAVSRGVENALLIGDMPFMSYHTSTHEAIRNAGRLVQEANAQAVKLEGGARVLRQVRAIVNSQIPVMGHLGLTPQSVNVFGGFKVQGKDKDAAAQLIEDAERLEDAGVFAIVLECIPGELAARITAAVSVPTIGIGAGAGCDGQILVYHDILGLYSDVRPKHVKVFAEAGKVIREGINEYVEQVKNSTFPGKEHSF
ncbi:MAG: 3-methyl-2-oxobutanoate hydroxymethyltransferase [Bacteroidota bacterium]